MHKVCEDRRPNRTGEIIAAGDNADSKAAVFAKPERRIGQQRREGYRAASTDQQTLNERELADRLGAAGCDKTERKQNSADADGNEDADTIGQTPHENTRDAETDHR